MHDIEQWVSEIVGEGIVNYEPNALGKTFAKEDFEFEEFINSQVNQRIQDGMYEYIVKHVADVLETYGKYDPIDLKDPMEI